MTCTVCRHSKRSEIDRELALGEPHRRIAKRWGLSEPSVQRHKAHLQNHPKNRSDLAHEALQHVVWHMANLRSIAEACRPVPRDYLLASREFARGAELLGKFTGALVERHEITHVIEPPSLEGTIQKAVRLLREVGYVVSEPYQNAQGPLRSQNGTSLDSGAKAQGESASTDLGDHTEHGSGATVLE